MKVIHWTECEEKQIDRFPYKGKQLDVIGTSIRWLSQHGEDESGIPEYGLRFLLSSRGDRFPSTTIFITRPCIFCLVSSSAGNLMQPPMNSRKKWCADPEHLSISRVCIPTA